MSACHGKCEDSDDDDFYVAPFIEEPYDPSKKPMYCKHLVYADGEEYSLEEIRARQYLKTPINNKDMKLKEINGEKQFSVKTTKGGGDDMSNDVRKKNQTLLDSIVDKENYPSNKAAAEDLKDIAVPLLQNHLSNPRSGLPLKENCEKLHLENDINTKLGKKTSDEGLQQVSICNTLIDKEKNPDFAMKGIAVSKDSLPKSPVVPSKDRPLLSPRSDAFIDKENYHPSYVMKSTALPQDPFMESRVPKHCFATSRDKQQLEPINDALIDKENNHSHVKNDAAFLQDILPALKNSDHQQLALLCDASLDKKNIPQSCKNSVTLLDDIFPASAMFKENKTFTKDDANDVDASQLEDDVFLKPTSHLELDVTSYTKAFSMPAAISTPGIGGGKSRIAKLSGSETKSSRKVIGEKVDQVGEPVMIPSDLSVIEETSRECTSGSSANSAVTLATAASDKQTPIPATSSLNHVPVSGGSSRIPTMLGGMTCEVSRSQASRIPSISRVKPRTAALCDTSRNSTLVHSTAELNETVEINSKTVTIRSSNKSSVCASMDAICKQMKDMIIAFDPFEQTQTDEFLSQLLIPVSNRIGYYCVPQKLPQMKTTADFHLRKEARDGGHVFKSLKVIGQGAYAKVYKGYSMKWKKIVALKVQKPACPWEFYISQEIHNRVTDHLMKNSFMNIKEACFFNDGSILISDYMEHGTLLDAINLFKIRRIKIPEALVVYFTLDVLRIIKVLHSCKIIHADIKPDNFLLRKLPQVNEDFSSFGQTSLQLIDLGRCIDMSLYPPNTCFDAVFQKTFFQCIEMRSKKQWTYQVDMFHIASLVHVMIFGDFMDVISKDGIWNITKKVPRNLNQDLWNWFFNVMLNIESCSKLPDLSAIINKFENFFLDSLIQDISSAVSALRKFFNEDKCKVK